jgi:uncharacterized membrane protein
MINAAVPVFFSLMTRATIVEVEMIHSKELASSRFHSSATTINVHQVLTATVEIAPLDFVLGRLLVLLATPQTSVLLDFTVLLQQYALLRWEKELLVPMVASAP